MANTYSQLYIQIIFTVGCRKNLINENFRKTLEKYINGIIKNKLCQPIAIYCNPDHIHLFISMPPNVLLSDLVRDIKSNSSKFINQQQILPVKFTWQKGFGAFTYSKSQVDAVVKYINNQPVHHKKYSFKEEYLLLLDKWGISYDDRYVFNWIKQ